jgi:hypothetical protein
MKRRFVVRVLVWVLFAGIAVGALVAGFKELSAEIRSYRWEQTQGTVGRAEAHRAFTRVFYSYDVGRRSYSASHNLMRAPFRKLPDVGDAATVYYNPNNPEESLLLKGVRFDGGIPLLTASLVIMAILVGAALMNQRRKRATSPTTTKDVQLATSGKTASIVSGIGQRLSSSPDFKDWAGKRWTELEEIGPLAIKPIKRAFAPKLWDGGLNIHALLYPREPFIDASHYFLFTWYTSSIQQFLAEDDEFELADWFVPGVKEKQIDSVERFLRELQAPTGGQATLRIVEGWDLPQAFNWMSRLTYQAAWIKGQSQEVEMTAVCEDGYLSFFGLRM